MVVDVLLQDFGALAISDKPKKNKRKRPKKRRKKGMLSAEQKKILNQPITDVPSAAAKFRVFSYINEIHEKNEKKRPISDYVKFESEYFRGDGMPFVTCKVDDKTDMGRFAVNTQLSLVENRVPDHWGMVSKIKKHFVTIRIYSHYEIKPSYKRNPFRLELTSSRQMYTNLNDCINIVERKTNIHSKLMFTIPQNTITQNPLTNTNERTEIIFNEKKILLNSEQKHAVSAITGPSQSTFVLFGPPGTGKTSTLVAAITKLMRNNAQILICTPTNNSANVITEALIDQGFKKFMFRMLAKCVDRFELNHKLQSVIEESYKEKRITLYRMPKSLDHFSIVVVTLDSVWKVQELRKKAFSHIFVDEAGQVPEMSVWKPLANFGDQARLIFAGDSKQLGPFTKAPIFEDPKYGYSDSIVARLRNNEEIRNNPNLFILLTKNYRSHKAIVDSFSNIFYDGAIEATKPKGHESFCNWNGLLEKGFPVIFHSVKEGVGNTKKGGSTSNIPEAVVVVNYINEILKSNLVKELDIGVISFYRSQTDEIKNKLGKSNIIVDSIERFQGGEKRVIIVTAARTGDKLGFLKNPARLNTAISRAKQLLIVVGHAPSLEKLVPWKQFIDYCRENKVFIER